MVGFMLEEGIGLFEFLDRIRSNNGLLVLVLIAIAWFLCHLVSRLLWKVWQAATAAKDQEIMRLMRELEKYQSIVFKRLLGLDDVVALAKKEWPEEGGSGNSPQEKVR